MKKFENWQALRDQLNGAMPRDCIGKKGEHPFISWENMRDLLNDTFDEDGWSCIPVPGTAAVTHQEDMKNDRGGVSRHASGAAGVELTIRVQVAGENVEIKRSAIGSKTSIANMNYESDGRGAEAWCNSVKAAERSAFKRAAALLGKYFDPAAKVPAGHAQTGRPAQSRPQNQGQNAGQNQGGGSDEASFF